MVNEGVGLELGEARVFKRSGRGLGTIRGREWSAWGGGKCRKRESIGDEIVKEVLGLCWPW